MNQMQLCTARQKASTSARAEVLAMTTASLDWPIANTSHGMLVAFGEFLSQHGLIERMMQVPIPQKTRRFAQQAKLVEFLAGILSGSEHLQDLNDDPHPVAKDGVVARAWDQAG